MRITYLSYDNSGVPSLVDPTGASVSTGSTTTAGLAEADACAMFFGSPLIVDGNAKAVDGSGKTLIRATTKYKLPAATGRHIEFRGLDLLSSAPETGIEYDTNVGTDMSWTGRLTYTGSGQRAIWENPVSPVPGWYDSQVIHKYNTIKFPFTIIGEGSGATIVRERNPAVGQICNNRYFGAGYNGGLIAEFGIGVKTPGAGQCDVQNEDFFGSIGACTLVCLQEGWGALNPTGYLGTNFWQGALTVDCENMICYYATFGILNAYSRFTSCSINQGSVGDGIIFNAGTNDNKILCPQIVAPAGHEVKNLGGSGNVVLR